MRIVSKAMRLRLAHQLHLGRPVSRKEVAEATGISRTTLRRIEDGVTDGIDFDTLAKLCSYYGVGVGEVLEFEANNRAALSSPVV